MHECSFFRQRNSIIASFLINWYHAQDNFLHCYLFTEVFGVYSVPVIESVRGKTRIRCGAKFSRVRRKSADDSRKRKRYRVTGILLRPFREQFRRKCRGVQAAGAGHKAVFRCAGRRRSPQFARSCTAPTCRLHHAPAKLPSLLTPSPGPGVTALANPRRP